MLVDAFSAEQTFIFGVPFNRAFYTYYDSADTSISIAKAAGTSSDIIRNDPYSKDGKYHPEKHKKPDHTVVIIISVCLAVFVIAGIVYIIRDRRLKRQRDGRFARPLTQDL